MDCSETDIRQCAEQSTSRLDMWIRFLNLVEAHRVVELGVYRGEFAATVLRECAGIEKYFMLDPWRHLDGWNKPANEGDNVFEKYLQETRSSTEFAAERRVILQGKTTEVVDRIADGELDFAYIDGDHTLKGITIDLIRLYPKIRDGGWIGGDDFSSTIWQHKTSYEPTLVFPFAVYFSEAVGARIYALPHSQFLLQKRAGDAFEFSDLTGRYGDVGLRQQLRPSRLMKLAILEKLPLTKKAARRARQAILRG
jgi:hypothetical protein